MEQRIEMLKGFVTQLKILDQEFLSSAQAMEYASDICDEQEEQELEQIRKIQRQGLDIAVQGMIRTAKDLRSQAGADARKEQERQEKLRERLLKCRYLLALAENVPESIVPWDGRKVRTLDPVTVEVEKLLAGEPDLEKLAYEVNQQANQNRAALAGKRLEELNALCLGAKLALTGEIRRICGELAKGQESFARETMESYGPAWEKQSKALEQVFDRGAGEAESLGRKVGQRMAKSAEEKEYYQGKLTERLEKISGSFLGKYPVWELEEQFREAYRLEPETEDYRCVTELPQGLPMANVEYELSGLGLSGSTREFLERYYPFACRGGKLSLPVSLGLNGKTHLEFTYPEKQRAQAVTQACAMAARMFLLMPPGMMQISFADPQGLGSSFAAFAQLSYGDAEQSPFLGGGICASPREIDQRLMKITERIAWVNQNCLRGRYGSLDEYNRSNPEAAESYHVLMLMDYPAGLSDQGLERLGQILKLGPKCGVYVIAFRQEEQAAKARANTAKALEQCVGHFARLTIQPKGGWVLAVRDLPGGKVSWRDKPSPWGDGCEALFRRLILGI